MRPAFPSEACVRPCGAVQREMHLPTNLTDASAFCPERTGVRNLHVSLLTRITLVPILFQNLRKVFVYYELHTPDFNHC